MTRDFRRYLGARFLLTAGLQMQSVAVGWHIYELTRRPFDLGLVGLAQFLPLATFTLLGGHTADRFDRRVVTLLCQVAFVVTFLALFFLSGTRAPGPEAQAAQVRGIYVVLVLLGTTRAFAGPAGAALLTHLVPTAVFPRAVAWGSTVWQIAAIGGPALGGVIYGLGGARAVFATSAAFAAVACLLTLTLHVRTGRMEQRAASLATLLAGVRFVLEKKVILGTISLDLFAVLLGGAVALLPIFAREVLETGPRGLGLLRSAPAFGAAITAFALAQRPLRRRAGPVMLACVGIFGVATVVFALSRSFLLSLAALAVLGASDMVSVVIRSTVVQLATPPAMRGRVSAVNQIFIGASNELGEFESGLTAAWLGAVRAAALGGLATCAVVATWTLAFPSLRRIDTLDADERL